MALLSKLDRYFRGDKVILLIMIFLSLFSFFAVSSSTDQWVNQLIHILVCFGTMIVFYKIDYRLLSAFSVIFLGIAMLVLLATLFLGSDDRTLQLGTRQIQTLYFVGFWVIFFIAKFIAVRMNRKEELDIKEFAVLIGVIGVFCALMTKSNFSTAFILALSCMVVLFVGNIKFKYLMTFLVLGGLFMGILFATGVGRGSTGKNRVEAFSAARNFDTPPKDRATVDYIRQMVLSQAAIARSAWVPAGPGQGAIKRTLAEKDTDYIYATVVEETGIIAGTVIIFFYLILFYRAMRIARKSKGYFGRLLAVGIGFWITCQALLHIAVNCALIPATGQTLPMISRGGASMLFSGMMMGVLLNISKQAESKYQF